MEKLNSKMIFSENNNIRSFFCWMIFLFCSDQLISDESGHLTGYSDIAFFKGQVIAVGTDGRIDRIFKSGESITIDHSSPYRLNCAFSNHDLFIAAGEHGTILVSSDGISVTHAESGTVKNIFGMTLKNGMLIAGSERGTLLISNDGQSWSPVQTKARGDILSLSSNHSFSIGVTDAGEIMKSSDGINWEIRDYNKEYTGYNKVSQFKKILAAQNRFVIIGEHDDASPSILFSSLGNVWAERLPVYHDDGQMGILINKPNGITYDPDRNQFILACDNGELLSLPGCTQCNQYTKISENDLNAILYTDNCLVIAGDEYSVFIQTF
jgi:hypothetical protein